MGHRLSKIYTRTGDDGTTGLANGERIDKADARVAAFGDVDETNSALGLLLAEPELPHAIAASLTRVQHELFEIGAELSLPGYRQIVSEHVAQLERDLDALNDELPPLKEFVLPGGTRAAALCHLARTICRRAERSAWAASKLATLNPELLRYLNRLSDLLFVMARYLARRDGGQETLWQRR
jgi:cob(I)alamin adenosyltransferase